eukprot:scaffold613_cov243-Pinguiococcus_pyrenoidosus.AAC.9
MIAAAHRNIPDVRAVPRLGRVQTRAPPRDDHGALVPVEDGRDFPTLPMEERRRVHAVLQGIRGAQIHAVRSPAYAPEERLKAVLDHVLRKIGLLRPSIHGRSRSYPSATRILIAVPPDSKDPIIAAARDEASDRIPRDTVHASLVLEPRHRAQTELSSQVC